MAVRVQATLRIGGTLARSHLDNLSAAIAEDHAYLDWSGAPFDPDTIEEGVSLVLTVNEIIGGELGATETFYRRHHLTYPRWSGRHVDFKPVRVVFNGAGVPREFPATSDNEVLVDLETIRALGSIEGIERHLHVTAVDIDPRAVHMAYIQLSLLHVPAMLVVGNSLSLETRERWFTPAHILGGWATRLARRDADEAGNAVPARAPLLCPAPPPVASRPVPAAAEPTDHSPPRQLSLF